MMFELSPLETAANASARSIPASTSTSRSKPIPVTVSPVKSGPSRRNASGFWSMTATVWPRDLEVLREGRADPPTPHDHDVHA